MTVLAPVRSNKRKSLGDFGERLAATHLEAGGYTVITRNYRTREGEIDVIARKDGVLAFVEVRSRRGTRMGSAAESITRSKAERMVMMAEAYASQHSGLPASHRIDVVAIDFTPAGKLASLRHIENAVEAEGY
jgi:putative endonuclease